MSSWLAWLCAVPARPVQRPEQCNLQVNGSASSSGSSCRWTADSRHVFVDWGTAGRHVLRASDMRASAGVTLAGVRSADEDPVSATFVQPMRGVHFTLLEQFDSFNKMADTTTSTLTSPGCEHVPLSAYNDSVPPCGATCAAAWGGVCVGWAAATTLWAA